MRRIWWLVALAVVIVATLAYGWREAIPFLHAATPPEATAASAPAGSGNRTTPNAGATRGPAGGQGRGPGGTGAAPPFAVATTVAVSGSLPNTRQTLGWIASQSATNLTSQTAGIVAEIDAQPGTDVKKGDVLLKLDPRVANAAIAKDQASLQRDQATLDQAKRTAASAEALVQHGADTAQAAQQAETAQAVAEATIAVDNAQLAADQVALDNMQVRAPFDGRIGAFQVAVGSLVQPTSQVVMLTQMAPVDVQFSVPEADLAQLRTALGGNTANVMVKPADGGPGATGAITFLDSTVDRASGTVQARGTLANADRALWPGESVNVSLDLGERRNLVLVPTIAVVPQASGSVAYVVKPDKTIDVRTVAVAGTTGDMTALSSGVAAGEHVVSEGQFNLTSGQRVAETVTSASAITTSAGSSTGAKPASSRTATPTPTSAPAPAGT